MPAPGAVDYTALPASIRLWLIDHPGEHRAVDIARGVGRKTQPVANALGRMARNGQVLRDQRTVAGRVKPITYFALPPSG